MKRNWISTRKSAKYWAGRESAHGFRKLLKVGNGFEDGVTQGPLIEDAAVDKVQRHVADAIAKGGKLLAGRHKLQGQFFEPTVISEATADMLCAKEETLPIRFVANHAIG